MTAIAESSPEDLGSIARLDAVAIRAAADLVCTGEVFRLDYPLDAFRPPLSPNRHPLAHQVVETSPNFLDDRVDALYLQASSQIDGLRHVRHPEHGFHGGRPDETTEESVRLGIHVWADHGIVGRGVVVDVERYLVTNGSGLDHRAGESFGVEAIDGAAADQGVELRSGDILLLHTGWCRFYMEDLDEDERAALPRRLRSSGIEQSASAFEWFRDHDLALVAADNLALEVYPVLESSPFVGPGETVRGNVGMMHRELIPTLGLAIGELWRLGPLAAACAADDRWTCLLVAAPLNLVGGVGSPANATAIR